MTRIKRFFTATVMFVTVLSMSVIVAPKADAASAGDLIKMNGLSSVYYLAGDGKRYVFPNEQTFFSWYGDFSSVVTISQSELEAIPLGKNVTMRPGTKLVKITTDPKVYSVEPNGTLVWVASEAVAKALWGDDWAKKVIDVPDAFFTNYTIASGRQVAETAYPAGSLVKFGTGADVYYIDTDGKARRIASEAAFLANRFNWNNVVTSSLTLPTTGDEITGAVSTITDTSSGAGGTVGAGTGLTVALASDTPASVTTLVDSGVNGAQSFIPVTKVNFTASNDGAVKVTTLKFKRGGVPSADTDFAEFYLYEGDTLLAKYNSISSGVLTFTNAAGVFTVPAGQTKAVTLKVNLTNAATPINSKQYNFSVNAASDVVTDGAAVSGSFPVAGNNMSVAQVADLGQLALASVSNSNAPDPGTVGHTLWKFSLAATNQDVSISKIKFTIIGTVNATDLANLKIDVAGTQIGSTVAAVASDKTVTFDLTTPYVIAKGQTKNVTLKGDVLGGTSRTYQFYIYNKEDIMAKDDGYGLYLTVNKADSYTRIGATAATTIAQGALTVSKRTDSPSGNIAKDSTGVEFAKFDFKATGEDIKIDTLYPYVDTNVGAAGLYQVKLFVDGSQVGTAQNVTEDTAATTTIGNSFIIPAGTTKTLVIKADVKTKANASFAANNTIQIKLGNVTGASYTKQSSGAAATVGPVAGNILTVKSGQVTVEKNVGYGDRSASLPTGVANATEAKVASFIITAGAGEGVDVSQITLKDADGTSQMGDNFQNLKIKNGTTQIGNTISNLDTSGTAATYDFTPASPIRIANGAQYIVDVYADIKGTPQDSATLLNPVIRVDAVEAIGILTNSNASAASPQNKALQVGFISTSGSMRVVIDPDTTLADQLVMGTTEVELAKFKLSAGPQEAIDVTELVIADNNAGAATGTLANFSLYDGATKISGPVQFETTSATTTYALVRFPVSFQMAKGGVKVLTVKADVSTFGSGATSGSTHTLAMLVDNGIGSVESVNAKGAGSGTSLTAAGGSLIFASTGSTNADQSGNAFLVYKTKITAAWASDTPSGVSTGSVGQTIAKVNITNTANAGTYSANVSLMNFDISSTCTNGATTHALTVYKDSLSTAAIATTNYVASQAFGASALTAPNFNGGVGVDISSGATKTFFVTLDTSDCANPKNLSVRVGTGGITWTDGVTSNTNVQTLPLLYKALTY